LTDVRSWFDLITAALWLTLSLVGIVLRIRRAIRLRQIILPEPIDARDQEYLESVKRSTYLRLGVKVVFLLGSMIALFDLSLLWWLWRIGIVVSLGFMIAETISVDTIRTRLGRPFLEGGPSV
jgi:hypothetical protein